jgi:hypothetical protein
MAVKPNLIPSKDLSASVFGGVVDGVVPHKPSVCLDVKKLSFSNRKAMLRQSFGGWRRWGFAFFLLFVEVCTFAFAKQYGESRSRQSSASPQRRMSAVSVCVCE